MIAFSLLASSPALPPARVASLRVYLFACGLIKGENRQVLALKLPRTGPVLIAEDLWHYTAELRSSVAPKDDSNPQQTLASQAAMRTYLKASGAHLWIEHDPVTFQRLKKAPDFIE